MASIELDSSGFPQPPSWVTAQLQSGLVIPAHPLALDAAGRWDELRQRALTRYYHAAGAGGLAVGVHTTQFAIRDPQHSLLNPVLQLAASTATALDRSTNRQTVLIAGVCGQTPQAVQEAASARDLGYHVGLLSLSALKDAPEETLIDHCTVVARELPIMGFYLQPAVGGRVLPYHFWRRFVEIPNVVAIKIAPFSRYRTLDVLRAVAESGRAEDLALYTGNDDQIVLDLITQHVVSTTTGNVPIRIVGGLLGHWACWTHKAVELLSNCHKWRNSTHVPASTLTLATQVTDCNAAFFDAANGFAGCIAGIHEVLRRQGLLQSTRCLDPTEQLSPGQLQEIDRVCAAYPQLADDDFVREHLDEWLE